MIKNYDQEIEKQYHPENYDQDLDTQILQLLKNCANFTEFCRSLEDNFIFLPESMPQEYWQEYS